MVQLETKDFILTKKIHNIVYELAPKTRANMVYMNDDEKVTLTEKIIELCDLLGKNKEQIDDLREALEAIIGEVTESQFQSFKDVWNYVNIEEDSKSVIAEMFKQKVTVEEGKGLSSNDFDDLSKEKLGDLYTKAELDILMEDIGNKLTTLNETSELLANRLTEAEDAVKTANEKLANISNYIKNRFDEVDEKITEIEDDIKELKEKPNIIYSDNPFDDPVLKSLYNGTWFHLIDEL